MSSSALAADFRSFRKKLAMLFTATVLCGGSAGYSSANRLRLRTETPPTASRPQAENAETPAPEKDAVIRINGRVLGPDGKPVKGARLYFAQMQKAWPPIEASITLAQPAPTGVEGRFHAAAKRPSHDEHFYLLAHAAGLGVDWIDLSEDDWRNEVTLRLPDDVPITGRVVNTEGRPVAGVSVSIARIEVPANEKLDDYLAGWLRNFRTNGLSLQKELFIPLDGITGKATTDKDGRFTLHGAGGERIVDVEFSGAGVARTAPRIITRAGFDPKPYNAVLRNKENENFLKFNRFPGLFAPSFTFIAEAGRAIEGVVKDADTGKPLAGCRLFTQTSAGHGTSVVSNAEGKYRIEGLAKRARGHFVGVRPPKDAAYLPRSLDVADTVGLTPIRLDVELTKGAIVTGRVVDRQTGKPLRCLIRSVALPGNKFFGSKPGFDRSSSGETRAAGEEDSFRIATIPGKALVMARVLESEKLNGQPLYTYRRVVPDPDHKEIFQKSGDGWRVATAAGGYEFFDFENAVKVVDVKEKGETRVEMFVDRGVTARIVVQDADGKPLAGAWAAGLTATGKTAYKLPEATATVYALDPEKPKKMPFFQAIAYSLDPDRGRKLVFFHPEKMLGGTAMVRGDKRGPIVVKLAPLGKISGRLLDRDGNPVPGVAVSINALSAAGRELYHYAAPTGNAVPTDKDGCFCIEGVVPDLPFQLSMKKGGTFFIGEPFLGVKLIRPGGTLDLGAVRVKPAR